MATEVGTRDPVAALRETVRTMVDPGGCAWHAIQTHESLTKFLVEEAAECIDAIDRGLPPTEVSGELGDVLYQVVFHAALAERDGEGYDLNTIALDLDQKLRARHPHVFGDRGYMTVDELNDEWERLKEDAAGKRRGSRGVLDGIPAGMPTLARAAKVVDRLCRAGITATPAADEDPHTASEKQIGDELLAVVQRAYLAGVDPDRALRLAVNRLADPVTP